MLTPAFSIEQDNKHVIIRIKAPLAKISETEVYIDDTEFKFYSKPYYLRLNLPGALRSDSEKAQYIVDEGSFVINVEKETAGQHFEGLDMLTKLLAPTGSRSAAGPLIEVIDSTNSDDCKSGEEVRSDEEDDEDFDWQMEQELYTEESVTIDAPTYGFAGSKTGVIGRMQSELHGVIDLKEADKVPVKERRALRIQDEEDHFDDDHYLADLYEDDAVRPMLQYKPVWDKELKLIKDNQDVESVVKLSDDEREKMLKLPRKEYLLSKKEQRNVMMGLVDILFAYCYDQRFTGGESNVESSWTICKLSPTLSWFEIFKNVEDVAVGCMRRSLTYPLCRHFKLSKKVLKDTCSLFRIGRRRILKCLLHMHNILQSGDNTYVLNDLYITDYCVWIQHVREKHIRSMADALEKVKLRKGDLGLNLIELERAAALVLEEQTHSGQAAENTMATSQTVSSREGEEDNIVAAATSALQGLHIQNPYTTDDQHQGNSCTCGRQGDMTLGGAGTIRPCAHCTQNPKYQDSGTEDSSASSNTPSDSSDSSDSSDYSSSESESENSDTEQINVKNVAHTRTGAVVQQTEMKNAVQPIETNLRE